MSVTYARADEIREIAGPLIDQFHPHLKDATILYVWRSEHASDNGKPTAGKARKLSGLSAYLAQREFSSAVKRAKGDEGPEEYMSKLYLMEIAADIWAELTASQRIALIDHELCHFAGGYDLRGHDLEEFTDVVRRHGLWKPDLAELIEAAVQKPLFEQPISARDVIHNANRTEIARLLKELDAWHVEDADGNGKAAKPKAAKKPTAKKPAEKRRKKPEARA